MEKDNLSNSELDVILDYQNLSLEEIIVEIKNLTNFLLLKVFCEVNFSRNELHFHITFSNNHHGQILQTSRKI